MISIAVPWWSLSELSIESNCQVWFTHTCQHHSILVDYHYFNMNIISISISASEVMLNDTKNPASNI